MRPTPPTHRAASTPAIGLVIKTGSMAGLLRVSAPRGSSCAWRRTEPGASGSPRPCG